ncbi:carbohydrate sulfotransferase 15-like [Saccostrea echinata]|uniref:carbohydrate sulfotransferase 15-like n=1 Tax=Saccostrea echinata TaxID=191078 RepID=UPI002A7FC80C|nr:carbohydrate sulfotransferase 15-like [Saccostrea echinata]
MDKCARISRHPDVAVNTKDKETMYWSWKRYGYWLWSASMMKTYFSDYVNYFSNTAALLNNAKRKDGKTKLITGDGTPMDMWDFRGWKMIPQNRGLSEPRYLTPHLIKHINPDVKLIVILRNPVDRLYSDYYFIDNGERNKNQTTFHFAVLKAINVLERCSIRRILRSCLFDFHINADLNKNQQRLVLNFIKIARSSKWSTKTLFLLLTKEEGTTRIHLGFYAIYLREWLSVFPREQMLILRTEDYSSNVSSVVKQVFKFLELRVLTDDELEKLNITISERVYVTKDKIGKPPMNPKTRQILENIHSSDIQDLYKLLNDERFLWHSQNSVIENNTENVTQSYKIHYENKI